MKTITEFILEAADTEKIKKQISIKLKLQEDVFINGEYSRQRENFIMNIAKQYGYKQFVSVFLDKAEVDDLGGIPVPSKDKTKTVTALPNWAKELENNKNDKQILFIDFDGVKPDVLNAAMPIVLNHEVCGQKFENMIVVGFGDVTKLDKPLQSRFKPIINA